MTDDAVPDVFKTRARLWGLRVPFLICGFATGAAVAYSLIDEPHTGTNMLQAIGVGCLSVVFLWAGWRANRVGIDADHDGVVVTTLWPKRDRFTWEELKDIEYEIAHPGQGARYYRLIFCLADHHSAS
jgi:hypothetical protein